MLRRRVRRVQLSLLLILFSLTAFPQVDVTGILLNRDTKEPIAYANIGIANSTVGTISNVDGSFELRIPKRRMNDTIIFSALGFEQKKYWAPQLGKNQTILLSEKVIQLQSVSVVTAKEKNKTFEMGNSSWKGGVIETDTTYAGRSMALLIENRGKQFQKELEYPVYVQSARLRIFKSNLTAFKFRVRIQKIDSVTMLPGEDILQESVVIESRMKNGWLNVDLRDYKIVVDGLFFVTFEQILDKQDRQAIASGYQKFLRDFPEDVEYDTAIVDGEKMVKKVLHRKGLDLPGVFVGISGASDEFTSCVREASHANWRKVRGILSAVVVLSNQISKE